MGKWITGKWRLFWHLCPECNSDAPEIDTCLVCNGHRSSDRGFPSKELKLAWWRNFYWEGNACPACTEEMECISDLSDKIDQGNATIASQQAEIERLKARNELFEYPKIVPNHGQVCFIASADAPVDRRYLAVTFDAHLPDFHGYPGRFRDNDGEIVAVYECTWMPAENILGPN